MAIESAEAQGGAKAAPARKQKAAPARKTKAAAAPARKEAKAAPARKQKAAPARKQGAKPAPVAHKRGVKSMERKKICITGITGHIGNTLCALLKRKGHEVWGFGRHKDELRETIFATIGEAPHYGDICDEKFLRQMFRGADVVVHCVAKIHIGTGRADNIEKINVGGTQMAIKAAAEEGVQQFIHFSSIHAHKYGAQSRMITEETPLALDHPKAYSRTKALADKYVMEQRLIDNVTVLKPTGVIGPNDYMPSEVGRLIANIANRKQSILLTKGFDWVDVRDVCRAVLAVIRRPEVGRRQSYLLSGRYVSFHDLARSIALLEHWQGARMPLIMPIWMGYCILPLMQLHASITRKSPQMTHDSLVYIAECNDRISHHKAWKDLRYRSRSFVDTLADTLAWFRERGVIETAKATETNTKANGS